MSSVFRLPRLLWAVSLPLLIAAGSPAAVAQEAQTADVVDCALLQNTDGVRVEITAHGDWSYRSFRMTHPARYVVDVLGAVKRADIHRLEGDGQFLRSVRSSQYSLEPQPVTRFVLDLIGNPSVGVEHHDHGLAVVVGSATTEGEARLSTTDNEPAVDPARPQGLPPVVYQPLNNGPIDRVEADHFQDPSGVARIAEPQRRDDDGSYARTMSINMQNADIRTILRAIADFSGRNIIASPEVTGTVTVALTDVPWREAMSVILRAHSFDFVEENGILRVDSAENLRNEELAAKAAAQRNDELEALATQIITIDYANADEVKDSVKSMLTTRGSVEVDERTNSLIVSDIPSSVEAASSLARELDTRTPQVHIDALLVDIDSRKSQEIGIDWGILNAAPSGVNAAGDVTVAQAITDPAGQVRIGSVQNWAELQLTIQGLARDNIANIISNPRITTTDNREATILVGQKIPLITQDVAGNAITRLETIGIRLIVTPHINSDQQITLDIHPEVSDLSNQATVQGGVIINTSEADTRVLVSNGETAVIGGLIRNVTTDFTAGVPVLKDIPVLGALFRTQSKTDDQRELVVFLTPTIVGDQGIATDREWQIHDSVQKKINKAAPTGVD